jgi:pimeloyl-ACP methyl ester carboxylesterase
LPIVREAEPIATFVLIHGAGDVGWYWHLVEKELRQHGHQVVAPDLPCDDDSAGLPEYAQAVVDAIGNRSDLIVVGQSFGGFTAPLVADRVPVAMLVLVAAMIPAPGEKPEDWFTNTGYRPARRDDGEASGRDPLASYHDVPRALAEEAVRRQRSQSGTPGRSPWPLEAWPTVPTRFVLCTQDRIFPPDFMRRIARERLGITPDEIAAGHCVALSRPKELADMLVRYTNAAATGA